MIGPIFRHRLLQMLPRISLFGAVQRSDVDAFIRPLHTAVFLGGETLFREGDPPGPLHLILKGRADLEIRGRTVATVGEGDLLGADALIGIHTHPMTAVARSRCVVVVITPSAIHRLARGNPGVFAMLMTNIARDFARRIRHMSQLVAPGGDRLPDGPAAERPQAPGPQAIPPGGLPLDPHPPAKATPQPRNRQPPASGHAVVHRSHSTASPPAPSGPPRRGRPSRPLAS